MNKLTGVFLKTFIYASMYFACFSVLGYPLTITPLLIRDILAILLNQRLLMKSSSISHLFKPSSTFLADGVCLLLLCL